MLLDEIAKVEKAVLTRLSNVYLRRGAGSTSAAKNPR